MVNTDAGPPAAHAKPLRLHRATDADAADYARIARDTFYDSYAAMSDPAMMATHLHRNFSEQIQRTELRDPHTVVLVAREASGTWAGFVSLRTDAGPSCVTANAPLQLARLYVVRAWHGRGAGAFLLEATLDHARRGGHDAVWLQVWDRNARARRFYEKHGFAPVGTHPYQFADAWEDDIVLQRGV